MATLRGSIPASDMPIRLRYKSAEMTPGSYSEAAGQRLGLDGKALSGTKCHYTPLLSALQGSLCSSEEMRLHKYTSGAEPAYAPGMQLNGVYCTCDAVVQAPGHGLLGCGKGAGPLVSTNGAGIQHSLRGCLPPQLPAGHAPFSHSHSVRGARLAESHPQL